MYNTDTLEEIKRYNIRNDGTTMFVLVESISEKLCIEKKELGELNDSISDYSNL